MAKPRATNFYSVVTSAISDITTRGFDSAERLAYWMDKIKDAAETAMPPISRMEKMLRDAYGSIYRKLIDRGEITRYHHGVERFTLQRIKPQLRAELDRRILASAALIKLNRAQAIEQTLQRFAGWSTSIPAGGSKAAKGKAAGEDVRKALAQLPFVERRVLIDQGHKLTASLNDIVAKDGGAIAAKWRSNWRQAGYDYRDEHKDRDGMVYAVRDNWAARRGLMIAGPSGYYDKVTAVGEEINCRCYIQWIYHLGGLPKNMLTKKGEEALREAKADADVPLVMSDVEGYKEVALD
jgi:hypothetical protein